MAVRVLVVDDLPLLRDAIREVLQDAGMIVAAEAENGRIGIDMYRSVKPDVVLMDITMPEMDGIEALRGIRRIDPQAAVVMCSAMGQREYIIRAIQCGARDFVVKPFKRERILSAVERAARTRA